MTNTGKFVHIDGIFRMSLNPLKSTTNFLEIVFARVFFLRGAIGRVFFQRPPNSPITRFKARKTPTACRKPTRSSLKSTRPRSPSSPSHGPCCSRYLPFPTYRNHRRTRSKKHGARSKKGGREEARRLPEYFGICTFLDEDPNLTVCVCADLSACVPPPKSLAVVKTPITHKKLE